MFVTVSPVRPIDRPLIADKIKRALLIATEGRDLLARGAFVNAERVILS
jgi:hypothetical protein